MSYWFSVKGSFRLLREQIFLKSFNVILQLETGAATNEVELVMSALGS